MIFINSVNFVTDAIKTKSEFNHACAPPRNVDTTTERLRLTSFLEHSAWEYDNNERKLIRGTFCWWNRWYHIGNTVLLIISSWLFHMKQRKKVRKPICKFLLRIIVWRALLFIEKKKNYHSKNIRFEYTRYVIMYYTKK